MIEIKGVSKAYNDRLVVDDVHLTIPAQGITSIIGPNGAGKSTLLTMASRLTPMDKGEISVGGLDILKTPSDELAKRLSILRQENVLTSRLTVRELVTFGRYPYSKGRPTLEDRQFVDSAIRYLGLEDLQNRFLDQLSGGQRQRAFVAMVICQDTDYVLLDEPLNNLDMNHSVSMMKQLRRAADELGKTIVIVVHDINFASCYSDTIVAMRDGKLIAKGSPSEIIETDCLKAIYDMDINVREINGNRIAIYYS
ncbi:MULTISPECIES: iron ABC transporter ATP-binding protein [unclassified Bartonella]|uniref:iron ABC transporter ATP-binding protein n=1 Tax=unclassified Bartonella TaxID=2645622 RepID=UPI0015F88A77|nr:MULTISPECIES: ABC transporter ATP-binding protein [unclassified Bartonella]UXN03975.1 ABC transporter ATP-binding protein [Bartonella sp. HY406]UXN06957.1 ABC transporter ATP-binding protein [Bartonella sp. HY761]